MDRLHRAMALSASEMNIEPFQSPPRSPSAGGFLRVYVTPQYRAMLMQLSDRTGVCVASIVGQAIDQYLRRELPRMGLAASKCEEGCHG
jgi:Ribbon-helix-helix domain